MNYETIETIRHHIRWVFMAAVTATMLTLTFEHARRGLPGMGTAAVYALTVGFGLEYLLGAPKKALGASGRVR